MESQEPLLLRTTALLVLGAGLVYGVWFYQESQQALEQTQQAESSPSVEQAEEALNQRYLETHLLSATPITEHYEITGDPDADQRIYDIASQRGYELEVVAREEELKEIDGVRLQAEVVAAWKRVREALEDEEVELELAAGFVSLQEQQQLFSDELTRRSQERAGRPYTPAQIAGGIGDVVINALLRERPLPGHSVHHSGFAITVESSDEAWLRTDGQTLLAEFGFVPLKDSSIGVGGLEVFEHIFVWVGTENNI